MNQIDSRAETFGRMRGVTFHWDGSTREAVHGRSLLIPSNPNIAVTANGILPYADNTSEQDLIDARMVAVVANTCPFPLNRSTRELDKPRDVAVETAKHMAVYGRMIERRPDLFVQLRTKEDFRDSLKAGQTGLIYGIEGLTLYRDKGRGLAFVDEMLNEKGVRFVGPTWNLSNLLATPCYYEDWNGKDRGLSKYGKAVVDRVVAAGAFVDLAHASRNTMLDILDHTGGMVVNTHAGITSATNHPRNIGPDIARKIADRGGVIGVPFVGTFVKKDAPGSKAERADVVRHINALVDATGNAESVVLGEDAGGTKDTSAIPGLTRQGEWGIVLAEDLTKYYTDTQVRGFIGENGIKFLLANLPSRKSA